jgi:hypothetical protein
MIELLLLFVVSLVNGVATWGVVRILSEIKFLRRDVDHAHRRLDDLVRAKL